MKRLLIVTALLITLAACGAKPPASDPVPTIETSDAAPSDSTTSTTPTTTTSTTTAPLPAAPTTDVPEVTAPPAPYTPPPTHAPPPAYTPPPTAPAGVYYANCAEARAAGAAPLHRGDPGYRPALDRDGDGVACEK